MLMSPRVDKDDVPSTPKHNRPWQRFFPSPSSASPSASILKRAGSLPGASSSPECSGKRRRVKFCDPPVSEQVEIPRLGGKMTALPAVTLQRGVSAPRPEPPKENGTESESIGSYVETPQVDVGAAAVCPLFVDSLEPITTILSQLTTKTWHKAAEKSLKEHHVSTVGDLCRMTEASVASLKGLKPPNNVATVKEAIKKFEKILLKREKIQQANSLLKSENRSMSDTAAALLKTSSLASIIETTTPDEEDKTMKEFYERPSPSPTELEQDNNPTQHSNVTPTAIQRGNDGGCESADEVGPEKRLTNVEQSPLVSNQEESSETAMEICEDNSGEKSDEKSEEKSEILRKNLKI